MTPDTNIAAAHSPREARRLAASTAIAHAAKVTGGDFGYLMKTASRESGYNVKARNPNSSASGMFQFIEQTWLATVKRHGAAHGLKGFADAISHNRTTGRYTVADAGMRKQILDLRADPHVASIMAAEHSGDNARYMKTRLGRDPHPGELYAAHFLGVRGAVKLIRAVEEHPTSAASGLFPSAAASNKSIFYAKGRAVTVASLYERLTRDRGGPVSGPELAPSEQRLYLAEAGGGASRRGADVLPNDPRASGRVVMAQVDHQFNARLASILSPTLAQMMGDEGGGSFRKTFG